MNLVSLVNELRSNSFEKEWLEFKENWFQPAQIGEYISAISNSAALLGRDYGYIVWGISNENNHEVVGTSFDPDCEINGESLKHFLMRQIYPEIELEFFEGMVNDARVVLLRIGRAKNSPTEFNKERFIRVGSSKVNLRKNPLKEVALFSVFAHGTPSITNTASEEQDLTFTQLKAYYAEKGVELNLNTFEKNLSLKTADGKYNIQAQLLSDDSGIPIRISIFEGTDKTARLYSIREFGHQCLLYSLEEVLRYSDVINIHQVDERNRIVERKEIPLFDGDVYREAIINAFLHNEWVHGNEPMITVFSDRIEILSRGTLPPGQTITGFFAGESIPVNKKLSEIFLQLHISEKTGRGVPKIVKRYGRSTYEFRENSIVVTIPFDKVDFNTQSKPLDKNASSNKAILNDSSTKVLQLLRDNPKITKKQLMLELELSKSTIDRAITELRDLNRIERVGSNKSGYWKVND